MRLLIRRSVSSVITLAVALSVCSRASAQQTLSISSNLVQVGVVVSDGKGPMRGLKAEDFVVLDKGTLRKVRTLTEQDEGTAPPATPTTSTFSNVQATGIPTIVLMDNLNVLFGCAGEEDLALARAKPALIAALKEMDIHTPVALYGLGKQLKMLCDFTCSREQLLDAVRRYDPTGQTWCEEAKTRGQQGGDAGAIKADGSGAAVSEAHDDEGMVEDRVNGSRGARTMAALQTIASHVTAISGRKNLLWLTANLPYSGDAIASIVTPAKITMYPVDSRGLQMNPHAVGIQAMRDMAADTGGIAYVNTNDIKGAIRSVIDDRSATYTLGFYVDAASVDGKFHNLKIHVKTPNARLRYASGYLATKSQFPLTQRTSFERLLEAAVRSPFAASAVPFAVKIERAGTAEAPLLRLTGTIGMQGVSLSQDLAVRRGVLDVYTVEQDAEGNVIEHTTNRMQLNLTDQQFDDYSKSGLGFSELVRPQAQTTVIRVIVCDTATSRMGSTIIPLAKVK